MPCSYEQSRCNQEAGSRLLHPLAQGLPLLQELLSSLSDTARSDCVRKALKMLVFQKHASFSFFPKPFPSYCSFVAARSRCAWVAGDTCSRDHLLCLWTNLYLSCWSSSHHNDCSKQFHAQLAPEHAHFQPWWVLFPRTRESTKEACTD